MNKKYIKFIPLIFTLSLIMITTSACQKAVNNTVVENPENGNGVATSSEENSNEVASSSEEINYLENGEIDTSDWKTYRNDYYGLEMKYPPFLEASGSDAEKFRFKSSLDKNYNYYFGVLIYHDELNITEKRNYFIKQNSNNIDYEEIKIENGYAFYKINLTKGGYNPFSMIFNKKYTLSESLEIYSETPEFKEYDPKYIQIFKTMLKTNKFDE